MILDSSVLIASLVADDALHAQAAAVLREVADQQLILPDRILEETLNVLTYDHGIDFALGALDEIHKNQRITIQTVSESEQREVLKWMTQLRKKMSFQDYVILYFSVRTGTTPLSFDRQLLTTYTTLSQ